MIIYLLGCFIALIEWFLLIKYVFKELTIIDLILCILAVSLSWSYVIAVPIALIIVYIVARFDLITKVLNKKLWEWKR